jgi:hypothetical protein
MEKGLAKRQTASLQLKELAGVGILRKHRIGREKNFSTRPSPICSSATE